MLFVALLLGFAGSLHCVGMCSPLVMAVTGIKGTVLLDRLLYNAGRIFTYAVYGSIVSGAGAFLAITGFQNYLSVGLGILLLIGGIAGITTIRIPFITAHLQKFTSILKSLFSKYIAKKTRSSIIILGVLNGLLPCGLTYLALTYCLALETPLQGFFFMTLFGAGTLPAMFGLPYLIKGVTSRFQFSPKKITTVVLIISGSVLIARTFLTEIHQTTENPQEIVLCR